MIQATMEAKKDALRQTQDGLWKLTITIHPNDFPQAIAMASPGTRYMVAFAEIGDDGQPKGGDKLSPPSAPPAEKERTPFHLLKPSQQAALKCQDRDFCLWLDKVFKTGTGEADAAEFVRQYCAVDSRARLDTRGPAAALWQKLLARFVSDTQGVPR